MTYNPRIYNNDNTINVSGNILINSSSYLSASLVSASSITTNSPILSSNIIVNTTSYNKLNNFRTSVTKVTGNITLDDNHSFIIADASSGDINVELPHMVSASGRQYTIKKVDNTNNNIFLLGQEKVITLKETMLTESYDGNRDVDSFGESVAINASGTILIVGAPKVDYNKIANFGAVMIYGSSSSGWIIKQILTSSNGPPLGTHIAINPDATVIIASCQEGSLGSNAGGVVVFRSSSLGWTQEAVLTSSGDGNPSGDYLASNPVTYGVTPLAINSDATVIIAASEFYDLPSSSAGGIVVFRTSSNGWRQEAFLTSSGDGNPNNDRLGGSIGINGNGTRIVAGSRFLDLPTVEAGAIIIYNSSSLGWKQEIILTGSASTNLANDYIGSSVAINDIGDTVFGGATNYNSTGGIFIFKSSSSGWIQQTILTSSISTRDLGQTISINSAGTFLVSGDPLYDQPASNAGAAVIFSSSSNGWIQEAFLTSSGDGDKLGDEFGCSVAINSNGTAVFIGEKNSDITKIGVGSVTVFNSGTNAWVQSQILTSSDYITQEEYSYLSYEISTNYDGNKIVASSDLGNLLNGALILFNSSSNGWQQETILTTGSSVSQERFNSSPKFNELGTKIVCGISGFNLPSGSAGALVIFSSSSNGWIKEALLTSSGDGDPTSDYLGEVCDMSSDGTRVIGGTYRSDLPSSSAGAIIVFQSSSDGWRQEAFLTSSGDGNPINDGLGYRCVISADGKRIIGTSYDSDLPVTSAGAIIVFQSSSDGWRQEAFLTSSGDGNPGQDRFGFSIATNNDGTLVVAGSYRSGLGSGAVIIYRSSSIGWCQEAFLTTSGGIYTSSAGTALGSNVLLSNDGTKIIASADCSHTKPGYMSVFSSSSFGWREIGFLTSSLEIQNNENYDFPGSLAVNSSFTRIFSSIPQLDIVSSSYTYLAKGAILVYDVLLAEPIENIRSLSISTPYESTTLISDGTSSWRVI